MDDLRTLSDSQLVESLRALEAQQRGTMATIVAHLTEIEERRLHLRLGYSSLFDYCQRALGLSEDEAYRRMTVSRMASKWPAIVDGLEDGSLHMSGVALLKPHLRAENCGELLEMARGASRRELERRLAARFPQADSAEFLRAQKVKPLSAERFALQLSIGSETRARLERVLDLMSHADPSRSLEVVIDRALDGLVRELEHKRLAKTKRSGPRLAKTKRPRLAETERAALFERDGAQCSFIGETGQRCCCRGALELDHITPLARGGPSDPANLRVLCRAHNRLAAEESFGRACVETAVTEARAMGAARAGDLRCHARSR